MNPPALPASIPATTPPPLPVTAARPLPLRLAAALVRVPALLWKLAAGALLCLGPVGSLLVMGWSARLAQRTVVARWWCTGPAASPEGFRRFAGRSVFFQRWSACPHWIVQQGCRARLREAVQGPALRMPGAVFRALTLSLWQNLRLGLSHFLSAFTLTILPCTLMAAFWWGGWNNSFHKGYEDAASGPGWSITGIVLLIAVFFYVPLAQARQAMTGEWRTFFQWRLLRRLVRSTPFGCLLLAAGYAAGMALMVIPRGLLLSAGTTTGPGKDVFSAFGIDILQLTATELVALSYRYYFWVGLLLLVPLYLGLRWLAARIYARAALRALRAGTVKPDELSPLEQEVLARTGWSDALAAAPALSPRDLTKRWAVSAPLRFAAGTAAALLWFVAFAMLYVQQFLMIQPRTWINHPLLLSPWVHTVAPEIVDAARAEATPPR